ncbi:hypothetical protein PITC_023770 [Penicillium italicum]|uniref:Uncharacterized protein n=1 Tax=Penicillium italicum TaxID=40296 RepID=A0A0A2LL74_PENIT|nr:hypothetical protein PITC_023770 [Penicillium italicum]
MSLWLCVSCYFLVSKYGSEFIYGHSLRPASCFQSTVPSIGSCTCRHIPSVMVTVQASESGLVVMQTWIMRIIY